MKLKYALICLVCIFCFSCKINRYKNHLREGKWIEKFEIDTVKYVAKGKFRHDDEIKTWNYFANKKLIKKEVYENGICFTTHYHTNGKVASIGKTKSVFEDKTRHWFYFGDWIFYDENGKIELIRYYENGELINETQMN